MILVVAATSRELDGAPDGARCVCGIGPVDAARRTAAAIAAQRPSAVLQVGIAGARRGSGVPLLATVLGSQAVDCDAPEATVLDADAALLAAARRALPDAIVRPIGTSARVGGTTGTDVEAMEGHAVLAAAAAAGVPALELRVVSNEVEEADRALWRFDEAFARLADACRQVLAGLEAVVA